MGAHRIDQRLERVRPGDRNCFAGPRGPGSQQWKQPQQVSHDRSSEKSRPITPSYESRTPLSATRAPRTRESIYAVHGMEILEYEPVIRLACFVAVLLAMALWETLAPRRRLGVRRTL